MLRGTRIRNSFKTMNKKKYYYSHFQVLISLYHNTHSYILSNSADIYNNFLPHKNRNEQIGNILHQSGYHF